MIDPELMCELPTWWKHINTDDYYLVLSDDADSLLSCKFLKNKFGLEIGGFYSFEKGLFLNKERTLDGWKVPIFVDLSISRSQFCFDNHKTFIKNPNAINPNVLPKKYSDKYCFSTLTLLVGLYGGIEKMSDTTKTLLLAVDGGYIGYYKDGGKWKNVNIYWLEKLGLREYLLPILEEHDMEYFQNFICDNNLRDKIHINKDGFLESNYSVPKCKFELIQPVEKLFTTKLNAMQRKENQEKILTSAETYKDNYVLNIAI